MSKRAVVILAEGFEEIEAITPVDVLRRAGVEVTLAGLTGGPIKGANGVPYVPDGELSALAGEYDAVILPGGMPGARNLGESAAAKAFTEKIFRAGKVVAAICAAPALTLSPWGILEGKRATCYPGMEKMFSPGAIFSADRVVVDGTITTSRGPGTALEFSFELARQLADADTAKRLAAEMVAR